MRTPVVSLGAGVQSTTLVLMAAEGAFGDVPELAVFADTGWEPRAVYDHLAWLERELAGRVEVVRVTGGNIRDDTLAAARGGGARFATMPLHLRNPDGGKGQLRRQCTKDYKLRPIRRELRRRGLDPVEIWLGISLDEVQRVKPSGLKWIENRWPLLERRMTRADCVAWLRDRGYPEPPKSACIGCPFMDGARWVELRSRPDEWADACDVDDAIRRLPRIRGDVFLHPGLTPLRDAVLTPADAGQLSIDECEGLCGV